MKFAYLVSKSVNSWMKSIVVMFCIISTASAGVHISHSEHKIHSSSNTYYNVKCPSSCPSGAQLAQQDCNKRYHSASECKCFCANPDEFYSCPAGSPNSCPTGSSLIQHDCNKSSHSVNQCKCFCRKFESIFKRHHVYKTV